MKNKRYHIRLATAEDVKEFYGSFPQSIKALVMEDNGELIGIACVTIENSRMFALSEMKRKIPAKAIWRGVLAFRELIKDVRCPILAICNKQYNNSPAFLEKVGFRYLRNIPEGDIYLWDNY